ncbi:hypothetical protein L0152_29245, partial [bacterium]|nr:hypothetical protein [bacterium]
FTVDAEDWRGPVTSHKLSQFTSVIAMPDGGVIAIGGMVHLLYDGTTRFLVLRIAANGKVIWKKSFESFADYNVFFSRSLEVTQSNGLVLAFISESNSNGVDVLKISYSGNVVWRRSLKADDYTFHSLGTTSDNGVVLFGTSTDSNRLKVIILKADGTISSTAGYVLKIPGSFKSISSPVQTDDGGFAISGGIYDQSNGKNYGFIAKIGTNRNVTIERTFRMEHGIRKSIYPARDGGFVLFGNSNKRDVVVLKVNSQGTLSGCEGLPNVQYGSAPRSSFGPLRIGQVSPIEMNPIVGSIDIGVTALVTNHTVANLCQ